ncbi:OmpL47-type beta-barrel domain-containing protein [Planomicrobium okeanokoites]|uniref:OmpL47-type beta-barrel domain-containing protein n=1 Tax=Planomicrobium okeanokoites TaxID=244 RepID=A0ABV7KHK5_PLAOK|nr:hypothetical protein [Planomicrobium okeanokoites]TAA69068.1 hypothetical protein D2910_11670 [Planomicrobium okeanokoites]
MKKYSQMSLVLSILLVLQFILPTVSVFAAPLEAPNDVKILLNNGNNIQVRWTAVTNVQHYNVYQISNGERKMISSPKYPYLNLVNQAEGEYAFEVTSYNAAEGESPSSELVKLSLVHPEMAAPQDLSVSIRNGNDLFLKWTEVEFATGYNIYQVTSAGKELVKTTDRLNWNFSNMPAGDYVYEVHSVSDRFGESSSSSRVSYSLTHPEITPPQGLDLSVRNGNDILLKWDTAEFATSYNIYQVKNGVKDLVKNTDRLNWNFANLPAGGYVYEVHSVSSRFGESLLSSTISHTLVHPEMAPPSSLTATITNGNDLLLRWPEVEFATAYKIYQIKNGVKKLVLTTDRLNRLFPNMPAGEYTYEVHSVSDRFGESKNAVQVIHTLIHPQMAAPLSSSITVMNGSDLFLRWSEVEFATGYKVYQVINGTKKLVLTTDRLNRLFPNMPAGDYVYEVHSFSDRFGESQAASQAVQTLEHPEMQAPTSLTLTVQNGNDLLLKWTEVEFATSYNIYRINDGEKEFIMSTDRLNRVFTDMPEDWYEYEVTAVSTRFGESAPANVKLTLGHPTVQSPELKLASFDEAAAVLRWNEISNAYAYHVFEVIDGDYVLVGSTDKISYTISDIEDGTHEYVVTVTHSRFGDSDYSNAVMVQAQNDVTPPVTTSNAIDAWMNQYFNVELTAEDDKSGVDTTYYSLNGTDFVEGMGFAVEKAGIQNISFYSVDKAGNIEEVQTAQVKIDKVAPETSSNLNGQWHQEFTVQLKAEDEESGVKETFYSVNGSEFQQGDSYTFNEEGIRTIAYYSTDVAGNTEEMKTEEVKIDRTAPETVSNTDDQWHQEYAVELTAVDEKSGVETSYYSVNGSEFLEGTSFIVDEDGIHTISFYSVDKAGNVEEVKTAEVKIDRSAPETVSNADGEWHQEFAVELTATDDKSKVAQTFYAVNDDEYAEGTNFVIDQEGINVLSFYSVNKAGGVEEVQTAEVKIDKTAPVTEAVVPEGWQQEALVELTATDDKSGVEKTFYSINGSEYTEGTEVILAEAGVNTVSFYSVDKVGNVEEAKSVEVNIDTTAPETTSNADDQWHQEFTIELTAVDDFSGVAKTFYSVNGSEFEEGATTNILEEGINEVSFYSVDHAGNKEEVKTVDVKIDLTAPETTSNISGQWLKEDFGVNFTVIEGLSGLDSTYYSIENEEFTAGEKLNITSEGITEVKFYSTDISGNEEQVKTEEVKIDKTAPAAKWEFEEEYALDSVLTLDYFAEDTVSGIAEEKLTVNGKEFAKGEEVSFDQPGTYRLELTVTDHAGWATVLKHSIAVYIPADSFKVKPGVIKGNSGVFSVEVSLPSQFSTKDFVLETATINGVSAINGKKGFEQQAQKGHFRFERANFEWIDGEQLLEFRGMVGGYLVIGHATVETKSSNKK